MVKIEESHFPLHMALHSVGGVKCEGCLLLSYRTSSGGASLVMPYLKMLHECCCVTDGVAKGRVSGY